MCYLDDQSYVESESTNRPRPRPGSLINQKTFKARALDQLNRERSEINSSIDVNSPGISEKVRKLSLPDYVSERRSGSTYGDTFQDTSDRRTKSKVLNSKVDFKREELSKQIKFPIIPKGRVGEEFVSRNSIKARINDLGRMYKIK